MQKALLAAFWRPFGEPARRPATMPPDVLPAAPTETLAAGLGRLTLQPGGSRANLPARASFHGRRHICPVVRDCLRTAAWFFPSSPLPLLDIDPISVSPWPLRHGGRGGGGRVDGAACCLCVSRMALCRASLLCTVGHRHTEAEALFSSAVDAAPAACHKKMHPKGSSAPRHAGTTAVPGQRGRCRLRAVARLRGRKELSWSPTRQYNTPSLPSRRGGGEGAWNTASVPTAGREASQGSNQMGAPPPRRAWPPSAIASFRHYAAIPRPLVP